MSQAMEVDGCSQASVVDDCRLTPCVIESPGASASEEQNMDTEESLEKQNAQEEMLRSVENLGSPSDATSSAGLPEVDQCLKLPWTVQGGGDAGSENVPSDSASAGLATLGIGTEAFPDPAAGISDKASKSDETSALHSGGADAGRSLSSDLKHLATEGQKPEFLRDGSSESMPSRQKEVEVMQPETAADRPVPGIKELAENVANDDAPLAKMHDTSADDHLLKTSAHAKTTDTSLAAESDPAANGDCEFKKEVDFSSELKSELGTSRETAVTVDDGSEEEVIVIVDDEEIEEEVKGFHFNDEGKFVDKGGNEFKFYRYSNHRDNQRRYEKLGEKVTEYVYDLLETRCKLDKVYIPVDAEEGEPRSFIFMSKNAIETEDKLMILIHGSGVVRAGQWTRSLIINEDLEHGSQLPFIEKAAEEGYEVIVLNTNLNSLSPNRWPSQEELIRGSKDPENHAMYVWENFIEKSKAKHIAIVAHSYGGVVTTELACRKSKDFFERVFAIAFTDSVHSLNLIDDPAEVIKFYRENARNWVTSRLDLDEPVKGSGLRHQNDAPRFSAGHEKHEWTSWSSFTAIFKFLAEKYRRSLSPISDEEQPPSTKL